jgi:hypothetical protein
MCQFKIFDCPVTMHCQGAPVTLTEHFLLLDFRRRKRQFLSREKVVDMPLAVAKTTRGQKTPPHLAVSFVTLV